MMRYLVKILLLTTVALLASCGQTGPLYFPDDAQYTTNDKPAEPAKK